MLYYQDAEISKVVVHEVGNRSLEDGVQLSDELAHTDASSFDVLKEYFFSSFDANQQYHLHHEASIDLNEVYTFAKAVFNDPETFLEQSKHLANTLYKHSEHPNIKLGEFCVALIDRVQLDGVEGRALGLFKSENKAGFLEMHKANKHFEIEGKRGIHAGKLDKGCLVFEDGEEEGYTVLVVDQTNRGVEARYWSELFLQLRHKRDTYFNTQSLLSVCKDFVQEALPEEYEVEKADQIDLLNKSIGYFKDNERFVQEEFEGAVLQDPEVIQSFNKFTQTYAEENAFEMPTSFEISKQAVNKKSRVFKSVLKLDKNFHIYIHGDRSKIERGVDDDGRKYYKVYYEEEQ